VTLNPTKPFDDVIQCSFRCKVQKSQAFSNHTGAGPGKTQEPGTATGFCLLPPGIYPGPAAGCPCPQTAKPPRTHR
jgi:hypothetical protein